MITIVVCFRQVAHGSHRSPEKTVQINKHIWLSWRWLREKKLSLLWNKMSLHLNKLECPSPKISLFQDWLKLAQWFLRIRVLNFVNVFSLFHNFFPLEKGGSFIWINSNSHHPRMLCAMFGWFWRRRWECESLRQRQERRGEWLRTTDKFWSESLLEPSDISY